MEEEMTALYKRLDEIKFNQKNFKTLSEVAKLLINCKEDFKSIKEFAKVEIAKVNKPQNCKMTPEQLIEIQDVCFDNSVEYAFIRYSDFDDVKDEEFHQLRKAFIKAYGDLVNYLKLED